jgi:pimeloyl-ACP methyl ester carboxylesterase
MEYKMKFIKKTFFLLFCAILVPTTLYNNNSTLTPINHSNDYKFIKEKLKEYHLATPPSPFSYQYKTEILTSGHPTSFALSPEIESFAHSQNAFLNHSIYFDRDFLLNTPKAREYHLKPKYFKQNVGKLLTAQTDDGQIISCTYFDRNSDKLMVVGSGFTNSREIMSPFIDIFSDHDIVIFDYRGHGYEQVNIFNPFSWYKKVKKMPFGVDRDITSLGMLEEKDVIAVVNTLKNKKKYSQINGMGICYSALIFVKAEGVWQNTHQGQKLFDHLILDSCWLSLQNFTEKLINDPKKIFSPQYGGWEDNWIVKQKWFQDALLSLAQNCFNTKFNRLSILDYLPHIKNVPMLFFYGKDDLTITHHEFEIVWNATQSFPKTAVVTSCPHVRNHIKEKEFYKLICDLFLELPHQKFIECLQNKNTLIQHYINKLKKT